MNKPNQPPRHVIADLIRNPEGQGMVVVILALRQYPQGGRVTRVNNTTQPTISPSPLMEEDQSLSQCLTREQRVKQANSNQPRPVILASRQYPQGGVTTRQNNLQNPPLP